MVGAKPVFVDVGDDYCMDMNDLELKLGNKTKAVITVHLYGQTGDMGRLMELKRKYGLLLVEDACQAHGAEYQGKKAGSFGDIACFSFYPSKNMTVAGEGGMTVTNDMELDAKIKALRNHGIVQGEGRGEYVSEMLGLNFRMSEISAAIGIVQLKHLEEWVKRRRELANLYSSLLPPQVVRPKEYPGRKSVYCLYVIRAEKRDELRQFLTEKDIATGIHYPVPLHKQPVFATNEHLGKTETVCRQILSLPMFPQLREEEVEFICQAINDFYQQQAESS
jgi:dTDP-4-amino-4,6-dideoxygalactose transaminase